MRGEPQKMAGGSADRESEEEVEEEGPHYPPGPEI